MTTNYLTPLFKDKYQKLLDGDAYDLCFSNVDGWMMYDYLTELKVMDIPQEERQNIWDDVRLNLDWFTSKTRPKPEKVDCIKESKIRLFKKWVNEQVDDLKSVDEILKL